jgi:hypothetical protein
LSLSVRPFLRLSLYCSFISAEIRCWSQDSHKATALTTDFFFGGGASTNPELWKESVELGKSGHKFCLVPVLNVDDYA